MKAILSLFCPKTTVDGGKDHSMEKLDFFLEIMWKLSNHRALRLQQRQHNQHQHPLQSQHQWLPRLPLQHQELTACQHLLLADVWYVSCIAININTRFRK
jgi:hypothetical protein